MSLYFLPSVTHFCWAYNSTFFFPSLCAEYNETAFFRVLSVSKSGPVLKGLRRGAEKSMTPVQFPQFSTCLAAADAKSLQLCPTLCDPIDGSPPGSPVPGILQARILEWVAISFSSAWKWKVKVKLLSCVRLLPTPWTVAYQAPPSMRFSRQEYWSGVPLPSPSTSLHGGVGNQVSELEVPFLQNDRLLSFTANST